MAGQAQAKEVTESNIQSISTPQKAPRFNSEDIVSKVLQGANIPGGGGVAQPPSVADSLAQGSSDGLTAQPQVNVQQTKDTQRNAIQRRLQGVQ